MSDMPVEFAKKFAVNVYLMGDVRKAEVATLKWADDNGIEVPEDIRLSIEGTETFGRDTKRTRGSVCSTIT